MFDKENIDCIIKELKELQSLADALAVCKPVPSSLLQLIKEKALRVATGADQVLSSTREEQVVTEKQDNSSTGEILQHKKTVGNLSSEQSIDVLPDESKNQEPGEGSVQATSDHKSQGEIPAIHQGTGRNLDLVDSLTLNERFRFMKNLFSGNESLMITTLEDLSRFSSLEEMQHYLTIHFQWDWESGPVLDFIQFLEKKIN